MTVRHWILRGLHVAVPQALARRARRGGASGHTQRDYDLATAVLSAGTGSGLGLGAALATGLLALTTEADHRWRIVAVAAAEEAVWRGDAGTGAVRDLATVAGFGALHIPGSGRSWPYHLVTGAGLLAVRRSCGPVAAAAVHAAHNLALPGLVERRRTATASARAEASPLPAAAAWPGD